MDDIARYTEALGRKPSDYQTAIFDFVVHGSGNAVVKALAGSGKTSTMIAAMKLVPDTKKCLFLAFNKSVQEEISSRLADYPNCDVRTVHSLGFSMLSRHFKRNGAEKITVDEFKYNRRLRETIADVADKSVPKDDLLGWFYDSVLSLLGFARLDKCQSIKEIRRCAEKHGIPVLYNECEVVKGLMEWGCDNPSSVDFADMVWIPYELNLHPFGQTYDWVFNDEAQDYAPVYVDLFRKCLARGARFISCGDSHQRIYGFAGASADSFAEMESTPNTKVFSLPVLYRCDMAIIREARRIVPDIEPKPGCGPGIVTWDSAVSDINDGDMVLCRFNEPLMRLHSELTRKGVPCRFNGDGSETEDILSTIDRFSDSDSISAFEKDGLFARMRLDIVRKADSLVRGGIPKSDAAASGGVVSAMDRLATIEAIGVGCQSVSQLKARIRAIFAPGTDGVLLSTIHKAKGLEADRVHIIRARNPYSVGGAESAEEENLRYVAITRARHRLFMMSKEESDALSPSLSVGTSEKFAEIEKVVEAVYGFKVSEPDMAKVGRSSDTESSAEKTAVKPTEVKTEEKCSSLIYNLLNF